MLQPSTSSNTNRRNLVRTRPIQWQNGAKAYCSEANTARLRSRTDKLCCKICSKYCPYRRPFRSFLRMLQKKNCFLARPCSCLFEFHFRKIVDVLVSLCHSGSLGDRCDRRSEIQLWVQPSRQLHWNRINFFIALYSLVLFQSVLITSFDRTIGLM